MKKLIAILLSVLMLCSVIPFAAVSVSAADEYYVELVADAEEVNAGDEVSVEVSLYGHEAVGLISALVKIDYDPNVFELETYYDEDEEIWMPPMEVGPKFSASSNRYITFGQIDEDTGAMETCLVKYTRATATASQAVKTNLFYTVTFKVKDDAVSGDYELSVSRMEGVLHGNVSVAFGDPTNVSVHVNGKDPEPEEPACEHEYMYACDKRCAKCGELTNEAAAHNVIAVDAKAPTCTANGNIAYWYCEYCGSAWADADLTQVTNQKSVKVPATGHTYTNAHDVSCDVCDAIRELILKAEDIILEGGTSVSEKKNGLAFKFDAAINGITWNEEYTADYSNATVTIEGVEYKLVGMGVIANNKGYDSQTADDVDGKYVLNVPAVKVYEDAEGNTSYSIRVLNIPADKLDAEIIVRPYYQYEANGEIVTVYGQDWASSYNDAR